jgi:hypothetical protein
MTVTPNNQEDRMKTPTILSALAALALAGCATEGTQVAQSECKVAPITTTSMTYGGNKKPVSSLDQRYAEMALASSDYRYRNLARNGPVPNNVEDALRDCN